MVKRWKNIKKEEQTQDKNNPINGKWIVFV